MPSPRRSSFHAFPILLGLILLAASVSSSAAVSGDSSSGPRRMVTAPLFPWYDDPTGGHLAQPGDGRWMVTNEPSVQSAPPVEGVGSALGPARRTPGYTWRDRDWCRRQLLDMGQAGIDVAQVVWFNNEAAGSWSPEGLKNLLEAALELRAAGHRVPDIAQFLDTSWIMYQEMVVNPGQPHVQDLTRPAARDRFITAFTRFFAIAAGLPDDPVSSGTALGVDLFAGRYAPVLARYGGKPVAIVYEAGRGNFFSDWNHGLFDAIQSRFQADFGTKVALFPDYEWAFKNPRDRATPFDLGGGGYVRWRAAVYEPFCMDEAPAPPRTGPDAIQIGPGYDDRRMADRWTNGSGTRSRDRGAFYAYGWQYAMRAEQPVVALESWNELHEGTAISDVRPHGRAYIALTRRLAARWRVDHTTAPAVWCTLAGQDTDGNHAGNDEYGLYQVDGGVVRAADQEPGTTETDYLTDLPPATDGRTVAGWAAGVACRRTDSPAGGRIYFDAAPSFQRTLAADAAATVAVTVEFLDRGTDRFRLVWGGGGAGEASQALAKHGSETWVRHTFAVPVFGLRDGLGRDLNHMIFKKLGCDFAIDAMGDGDEWVRAVHVARGDAPAAVPPSVGSVPWGAPGAAPWRAVNIATTGIDDNGNTSRPAFRLATPAEVSFRDPFPIAVTAVASDGATTDTGFLGAVRIATSFEGVVECPPAVTYTAADAGTTVVWARLNRPGEHVFRAVAMDDPRRAGRVDVDGDTIITRLAGGSETVVRKLQRELHPAWDAGAGVHGLSSGALFSGSSGRAGGDAGGLGSDKDFWLVVNTELILYGATEPDATLTVAGVPVKLKPDGTFSLRFAFPDGEQFLRVKAVNNDGDMERTVMPVVSRRTEN